MGLFSRLLNGKRRIDASQVVLNILNNCVKNGVTAGPQQELAQTLTALAWQQMPDVLTGEIDGHPNKVAAAIAVVANAMRECDGDALVMPVLRHGLWLALRYAQSNGERLGFQRLDWVICADAGATYQRYESARGAQEGDGTPPVVASN